MDGACISVELLRIQLHLRDEVYSLYQVNFTFGLLDCVLYIGGSYRRSTVI